MTLWKAANGLKQRDSSGFLFVLFFFLKCGLKRSIRTTFCIATPTKTGIIYTYFWFTEWSSFKNVWAMSVQRNLYVNQWDCADMSVSLWLIRGVFESLTSQIYKWNVLNVSMTLTFTLTLNVTNKAYQLFRYQLETEFLHPVCRLWIHRFFTRWFLSVPFTLHLKIPELSL